MLYDPKWELPDLTYSGVSLRGIIAWLETKPARESYCYTNPRACAAAQYKQSLGATGDDVIVKLSYRIPADAPGIWLWNIVAPEPQTFGAALERARKVMASLTPHS